MGLRALFSGKPATVNYQLITFEKRDNVAVLTLNQPELLNALSAAMLGEVLEALAEVRRDNSVRVLLLTANGKLFSAGAQLNELLHGGEPGLSRGANVARMMEGVFNPVIAQLRELPVPVVIALNGGVAGGAVGVALAADVIIAARSAYFYLPFVPKLGLVPDLGSSWFLERLLGGPRALALTLTGGRWSAEQAERWGMIHACVDDAVLSDQAMDLARQLASLPAHGVIEARRVFDAARGHSLSEQLTYETDRQRELLDRPTFEQGVEAFLAKRLPHFPGRESAVMNTH
jgi:2-(1,2-epoxy-1,2-dihydrophenyl)acetyl-CoA isomerase